MKITTIATAAGYAGLAALVANVFFAVDRVMAESRDNSIRAAAEFIRFAEPVTLGELHHAPQELREAAWKTAAQRWQAELDRRFPLSAAKRDADAAHAAADARLFEFARGIGSHVSEDDLAIGSPAAVAAASARLD